MEASFDLWKAEKVYYLPAIRETNLETVRALEEAGAAQPEATLTASTANEPAEGGKLPMVTDTSGSFNLEAPQEAVESIVGTQDSHTEEPPFLFRPLQSISLADVTQDLEANPAQLLKEGDVS